MEKQKITDRLQLLNDGRAHYLEFLRNLTPQIILFSIVLLLMVRIDFNRVDLGNVLPTLLFFFLLGSFMLAFYANSTLFYERCFSGQRLWRLELFKLLTAQGLKGHRRFLAVLKAIWRERFIEALEMLIVFWFFHIALAVVVVMSIHSAATMFNAVHPR